jgi:uncharacterized protein (DUF302 family)
VLYERQFKGTVDDAVARLKEAAAANKFGVLEVIDLKQRMAAKGVEFGPECRVLEVCNPQRAKKVLSASMAVSTMLPCRISVYEDAGTVKIGTVKPTSMPDLYGVSGLVSEAAEVEAALISIIDAACR